MLRITCYSNQNGEEISRSQKQALLSEAQRLRRERSRTLAEKSLRNIPDQTPGLKVLVYLCIRRVLCGTRLWFRLSGFG